MLEKLVEWLKMYKTTDGKEVNVLASDTPKSAAEASKVIAECHLLTPGLSVKSDPHLRTRRLPPRRRR